MKKNGKFINCKYCNKKFYVSKSRIIGKEPVKYCSMECWMNIHKTGKHKKICLNCNKEYFINFARIKTSKFCSYECMNIYNGKFNQGYNHPNWQGGITSFYQVLRNHILSKEWRNEIFNRDNYTCQECGDDKGGNLEAHHIKPFAIILKEFLQLYNNFSIFEDKEMLIKLVERYEHFWDINNGITLCEDCHSKITMEGLKWL